MTLASTISPVRVLIVEDCEEDFRYFSHLLKNSSGRYDPTWASNYDEGMRQIRGGLHDIALVDYCLGATTGLGLLREASTTGVEIPIIILTGHDRTDFDAEALEAGAAYYLCKNGLSLHQLERAIRYSLRHAEMLAAIRRSQHQLDLFVRNVPCAICIEDAQGDLLFRNPLFAENFEDGSFVRAHTEGNSWSLSHQGRHWLVNRFEMVDVRERKLRGFAAIDITERVNAEEMLRRTTSMLSGILDHLPVAASRIDRNGTILELNGRGLTEVGIDQKKLLGRNIFAVNPSVAGEIEKALNGGTVEFVTGVEYKGRPHHFHTHFRFDHERGQGAIGVGIDITRRVEAEMARKRQSQILSAIMKNMPVIFGRMAADGVVIEADGEGLARYGLLPVQLIGERFVELFPEATEAVGEALAGAAVNCELCGGKEGADWQADLFVCYDSENGSGAIFYARDITERKWLERKILNISDAEQQRIGADLHDGLGQHLTGIACLAAALRDRLHRALPAESEQANLIARLVNEATAQCRALARGLCPVQLEHTELSLALEDLTYQVQLLSGLECRFESGGTLPNFDHETAMHVYRITQEALNNAIRHASAHRVSVSLVIDHENCRVCIEDDGCGINGAAGARLGDGVGLRLMNYRSAIIGGRFEIGPGSNGGTRVECIFPT